MPFETPIPIRQAIQNILDGKYVLPAIQREFIWEPEQIELLFDSLLRGYPISSFLFWEVPRKQVNDWQFYKFLTQYHEYNARHNAPAQLTGDRDVTAVLDGQQRLTALVIALTGTYASRTKNKQRSNLAAYPVRKLYIDLLGRADETDEQKFYAIRFLTPEEAAIDKARFWVSFPELFLKIKSVSDVLMFMAMERISSSPQEKRDFAAQTLAKICESLNTIGNVNFFLEREADLDKVLQIFIRINSGGTKLSYSDLLLSIATASWKGTDARQAIHGFVDELNSVSDELTFDQDFVLKSALVLSDISDVKFKVENFNAQNMATIEKAWPSIKTSLSLTVHLTKSFGLSDRSLLSANALIPIAYYLRKKGATDSYLHSSSNLADRATIRSWLTKVLLRGTFGSMGDTILGALRGVLQSASIERFPEAEINDRLTQLNRSIKFPQEEIQNLLGLQHKGRQTFLVLSLLYPNFDFSNGFHIDHVYPRSKVTERRLLAKDVDPENASVWPDLRDNLANLQLLQGGPNQAKSAADFDEWLDSQFRDSTKRGYFLATHHFPNWSAFPYTRFGEFLGDREAIIGKYLETVLA
ncbi:DUF262 domain-containing protein [Bradyrhizobium sp. AUGA SZCCT0158]|uniref:DUF262 domain-containing protein n=1 Tax=Bradyrhizobium sp. AUGA SZCCT0158 TaxID=2807661 RepID=UPI001BA7132F|nr:DUF262 domain-containing protein [Bradyrhizobium sp. AUGA SZCCT0158]MBR1197799.1 DUF262 domain-containing protein [Bradyrhizobium sp. AUGA SZCCT0158]